VRTCDGYYFPVSFSTTREHFAEDKVACEQMCPAADTELFYQSTMNIEDGPLTLQSLRGRSYLNLANALRYRSEIDGSCQCRVRPEQPHQQSRLGASPELFVPGSTPSVPRKQTPKRNDRAVRVVLASPYDQAIRVATPLQASTYWPAEPIRAAALTEIDRLVTGSIRKAIDDGTEPVKWTPPRIQVPDANRVNGALEYVWVWLGTLLGPIIIASCLTVRRFRSALNWQLNKWGAFPASPGR
jgi:hypothetical protein